MSRTSTTVSSLPTRRSISVFMPEWLAWSSFESAAGSRLTGRLALLRPYTTAGMRPAARSLRAAPLPLCERASAASDVSDTTSSFAARRAPPRRGSHEERAHALLVVDAPDCLAEQLGDRHDFDLLALGGLVLQRDRVRHDQLFERRLDDALDGGPGEHGMRADREHLAGAGVREGARALGERPRGVHHVVDHDAGAPADVAHDVHHLRLVGPLAALVDDGERGAEALRVRARALDAARVRGDHRDLARHALADRAQQHGRREQVVDGDVEESLDLARVQIEAEQAVGAGDGDEVRDELGRDGLARRDLAVLARVAVGGHDGRDAPRGRAAQRVDHDEQLHQVRVRGRAGGLDDEAVEPAHVLLDLDADLAVAEVADLRLAHLHVEVRGDAPREGAVRVAGEELHVVHAEVSGLDVGRPSGWGGRTRTCMWRLQRPLPYQLGDAPAAGRTDYQSRSAAGAGAAAVRVAHARAGGASASRAIAW